MRDFILRVSLIFLLTLESSHALQTKAVQDDHTVSAKISDKELTRIFVMGDRIQNTRGINGAYEITKDEKLGAIFIKANPIYLHKPFTIFITTESGHTYNLLLTAMNIPAEEIELKPLSPSMRVADRWEKNSPYLETLIHLVNNMVNEVRPEGYAVIDFADYKPKKYSAGLTLQLVTFYRGNHLQGEVWKLKNSGHDTLYIKPRDFFKNNVLAISLEDEILQAGDETYLYKVTNYDR